jgi:hypothetical protein
VAPLPLGVAAEKWPPLSRGLQNDESPAYAGFRECAEEDSNLHPVIPDQALNLVTRVSDPSYASIASRTSTNLDASDVMDGLDVAAEVATASWLLTTSDTERRGAKAIARAIS